MVFASAYAGREEALAAGAPHLGHDLGGLRAGLQWDARSDLTIYSSLGIEERRYGGAEPLFNVARRDHQGSLVAGVHYALAPGWRLTPQVSYTDNRSNVSIYEFRRTVATLTLRREF